MGEYMKKRLTKSYDRMISGVLGGIAEYLGMDVTVVRILYVLLGLLTGFFPLAILYFVLTFIMPDF